jgi:hypothetical protein
LKATVVPIDSEVLGGTVLAISDFSADEDFERFEAAYVDAHDPLYVSCKVPLDVITDVHALERHGFSLIECQIRARIDLGAAEDISRFPYAFARVTDEEELLAVLDIAGSTFVHDRFSIDPYLGPGVSGERYRRYVRQSYAATDEAVYRLFDPASNKTVAFKTHRYVGEDEVLLLLGGVHPAYKRSGVGVINDYAELNELRRLGIKGGYTHISATNYPIFNLEIGKFGYAVRTTFAVMRKLYSR